MKRTIRSSLLAVILTSGPLGAVPVTFEYLATASTSGFGAFKSPIITGPARAVLRFTVDDAAAASNTFDDFPSQTSRAFPLIGFSILLPDDAVDFTFSDAILDVRTLNYSSDLDVGLRARAQSADGSSYGAGFELAYAPRTRISEPDLTEAIYLLAQDINEPIGFTLNFRNLDFGDVGPCVPEIAYGQCSLIIRAFDGGRILPGYDVITPEGARMPQLAPIPAPAGLWLMLAALGAVLFAARQKRA